MNVAFAECPPACMSGGGEVRHLSHFLDVIDISSFLILADFLEIRMNPRPLISVCR